MFQWRMYICTFAKQQLDDVLIASKCSLMQRRPSIGIFIDIRTSS